MKRNKFVVAIVLIALLSGFFGAGGTKPALAAPALLSDVAGMSAWYNTEVSIDLSSVPLDNVDVATSTYLIGSVHIDGYAAQYDPHVFVHSNGWIMAFYLNGEPAAKMIDVIGQTLTTTLLDQAVDAVAGLDVSVSYYDFSNPEATDMLMVAEEKDVLDIDNFFVLNMPENFTATDQTVTPYTYYEKSYAFHQNYYPKFTLNGYNFVLAYDVYTGAPTAGSIYGTFPVDKLLPGVDNLLTVDSFNLTGVVGFGAVLVTYEDLGEPFIVDYADVSAEYLLAIDEDLVDLIALIDCTPAAFSKSTPLNGATDQLLNPALSWAASDAENYEYCIDTSNDITCDTGWVSTGSEESVTLSGLLYETKYYWQVRTTNAFGITEADAGVWASFTTADGVAPGTFAKEIPSDGAEVSPTGLILDWGESYGAYYYEYCINTVQTCTIWVKVGTATSAAPVNLAFGTDYYWQVRAVNDFGNTEAGAYWSFTTVDSFKKVSPVDGAINQRTRVNLTWEKLGTSTYQYCIDTTDDTTCDTSWVDVGSATRAAVSGLKFDEEYFWQVKANNGLTTIPADEGAWWSFTTKGKPAPANTNSEFEKISPQDGAIDQPIALTLRWREADGATKYEYCIYPSYAGSCAEWVSTLTNTSAAVSDLNNSETYYWQVRATLADNSVIYANSLITAFWDFTTIAATP